MGKLALALAAFVGMAVLILVIWLGHRAFSIAYTMRTKGWGREEAAKRYDEDPRSPV